MRIKYLTGLATKANYNTKVSEIESKIDNHNHDKYVTFTVLNAMSANLITKTKLDAELKKIAIGLLQIKQKTYFLKMR